MSATVSRILSRMAIYLTRRRRMVPYGTAPTIFWVARWWGLPRSTPAVAGGPRLYGPFIATQDRVGLFRIRRIAPPRLAAGTNFLPTVACDRQQPSPDFPLAKTRACARIFTSGHPSCSCADLYPRNTPMETIGTRHYATAREDVSRKHRWNAGHIIPFSRVLKTEPQARLRPHPMRERP